MGILKGAVKTALAAKAIEIVRREAAKPENQAKARELLAKVTSRTSGERRAPDRRA